MGKLRLEIEDLAVESFETAARRPAGRGTVHGNGNPALTGLCLITVAPCGDTSFCVQTDGCPDTAAGCPDTGWVDCGYSYGGTCGASPPVSYDAGCASARGGDPGLLPPECV